VLFRSRAFMKSGYETGKLVTVRRPGVKVRLAFALDARAPDMSMFLCERADGPPQFAKELTAHKNGAIGLARVVMHEQVPSDFQYYLQTVSGERDPNSHSFGLDFDAPNGVLSVFNSAGLKGFYGISSAPHGRGLRLVAMDIAVKSRDKVKSLLAANNIEFTELGPRLIVSPSEGQGATLAFVEASN